MQLLLPRARSAVLVEAPQATHHLRKAILVFGLLTVLLGGLDLLSHIRLPALSDTQIHDAFAPAATLP